VGAVEQIVGLVRQKRCINMTLLEQVCEQRGGRAPPVGTAADRIVCSPPKAYVRVAADKAVVLLSPVFFGNLLFNGSVGHFRARAHFHADPAFSAVICHPGYGMLSKGYGINRAGGNAHAAAAAGFTFNDGCYILHTILTKT
jgi:hypothetical protein